MNIHYFDIKNSQELGCVCICLNNYSFNLNNFFIPKPFDNKTNDSALYDNTVFIYTECITEIWYSGV